MDSSSEQRRREWTEMIEERKKCYPVRSRAMTFTSFLTAFAIVTTIALAAIGALIVTCRWVISLI